MGSLVVLAVAVAVVAFGNGEEPGLLTPEPPKLERFEVGSGAEAATVVRPEGIEEPAPGVIFLHGWGEIGGDKYREWIDHIAQHGNVVIVPRYQLDTSSPPDGVLAAAVGGIRSALEATPVQPEGLVVAGHSAGAALAADYAATAANDPSLPPAAAVFAVFPGRAILGYPGGIPAVDPAAIPPQTRLVALAADADKVVGEEPAIALIESAVNIPSRRRRFVEVTDPAVDGHYAPLRSDAAARKAFWDPLDALIAEVR